MDNGQAAVILTIFISFFNSWKFPLYLKSFVFNNNTFNNNFTLFSYFDAIGNDAQLKNIWFTSYSWFLYFLLVSYFIWGMLFNGTLKKYTNVL